MGKPGVLSDRTLKDLMSGGFITGIEDKFVNPGSLDLPLDQEAFRLEKAFLPRPGQTVRSMLGMLGATPHDLKAPLEVGIPYLIHVRGNIELPQDAFAYANPKSSTGRVNLIAKMLRDGVAMYDAITKGTPQGETWILVKAESFPIILSPGLAISQLRFFDGVSFLDPIELETAMRKDGLLFHPDGKRYAKEEYQKHADSFFLSVRVHKGIVGWESRGSNKVLDFSKVGCYKPEQFFVPLEAKGDYIELRRGSFYILTTDPCVRVPPHLSAELRATDQRLGNSRVHSAGFIDAGWGYGKSGEVLGRPITLEVMVYEDNVLLQHGQNVVRIRYERMRELPEVPYDEAPSNYTVQSVAKLSKHFV